LVDILANGVIMFV